MLLAPALFVLAAVIGLEPPAQPEIPPPSSTPSDVLVSGRTSTLRAVVITDVGEQIPETFSGNRVHNAAGFRWLVSRHYAFQTDYDDARARHLLSLLELAYPHYVELFGREIPGIDRKRMVIVYGSTPDALRRALEADGINWDFGGGGVAFDGINAGFNYPSGSLQYHQRYIMLHEAAHLYQICLNGTVSTTPSWYYEGVADSVAHHVWDDAGKRLTMSVLDKPTVNNWYDEGLRQYAATPFTASDILTGRVGGRPAGFLLVNYFSTDLDRRMRWRIWRDELFRLAAPSRIQEHSALLIEELFGARRLDHDFAVWINSRRSTFHYVDWGWEQDGDSLISYGWPQSGPFAQTNVALLPSELAQNDPLVMDYPRRERSPLLDSPARGVSEPVIACLLDWSRNPNAGVAGLGFGVIDRASLRVMVEQRRRLTVNGSDLGASSASAEFTPEFLAATERGFQVGVTVTLKSDRVQVVARAGDPQAPLHMELSLPVSPGQRDRLVTCPVALLSRDGSHILTPAFDDGGAPDPLLDQASPPNRERCLLEPELYAATRALWRLAAAAPSSLVRSRESLLHAANNSLAEQMSARNTWHANLAALLKDIDRSTASPAAIQAARAELSAPTDGRSER